MAALKPFLTEIADAIREVDGSEEPIPALEFPNLIRRFTYNPPPPQSSEDMNMLDWSQLAEFSLQAASDPEKFAYMVDAEHKLEKDTEVEGVGPVKARIIGVNHDEFVAGDKAGFTIQLCDGLSNSIPTVFRMNETDTNAGGWAVSEMRTTNLPLLKAALPADLQALIQPVRKMTSTTNSGTDVSETEDELFLLSLVESIGTGKENYSDNPIAESNYLYFEGSQYEYYVNHPTKADHIIKDQSGSAARAWFRSIRPSSATNFYSLSAGGDWGYTSASSAYLPAAGFCL